MTGVDISFSCNTGSCDVMNAVFVASLIHVQMTGKDHDYVAGGFKMRNNHFPGMP